MNWNTKKLSNLLSSNIIKSPNEIKSLGGYLKIENSKFIDIESCKIFNDGILKIDGYHCIVYIKNDRSAKQKWHFYNCKTLKSHSSYGKRFVATRRSDGLFILERGKESILYPCQHCLNENKKNNEEWDYAYSVLGLRGKERNSWFIPRVLNKELKASSSFMIEPHLMDHELSGYSPDWPSISYSYRKSKSWSCESCKVNLRGWKNLLHTHHIDMNKKNNSSSNFKALCVYCHSNQPHHQKMKEKFKKEIKMLHYIRSAK